MDVLAVLKRVRDGDMSPEEAALLLKKEPYEDLGYAKVDHHRALRQGNAEIVYGSGKTHEQICGIVESVGRDTDCVLVTRVKPECARLLSSKIPGLEYHPVAGLCVIGRVPAKTDSYVAVVSAGTSDMPVAEEAALTAEALGSKVVRVYDVGVAGLHRLLDNLDVVMGAKAVIAVAGMEGALASVVGGLVSVPVIAVPTSVGYGASFGGLTALLSMMNSCASGVSVVNIDNGFGAGYLANMINQIGE